MLKHIKIAVFAILAFTVVLMTAPSGASRAAAAAPTFKTPIQHVVIIYQENHTFDDVIGPLCAGRQDPCNGYTGPVTFADGKTASNVVQSDVVPYVLHDPPSQRAGMANKWDQIDGCTKPPYVCVSHVDPSHIPNLAALVKQFAISDDTFAEGASASFGAHTALAAGTRDGFLGWNPVPSKRGHPPGDGWGCPSYKDDLWGMHGERGYEPSCVPDQQGNGPYRDSRVPYHATIMERIEQAGLTWHTYQGDPSEAPVNSTFSFCTYFAWCYENRFNLSYDSALDDFYTAAGRGTLPNLSILIPMGGISQHNGTSMRRGDNYIGDVVSAVENGPDWNRTVVFITYDDCGCFYDHVTPPKGLGLRNPMVIVSPWAKPHYTDSTQALQPYSMLAFVQRAFSLKPLSNYVSQAYDYWNSFDFSQRPLPGVQMTHSKIPQWEIRKVARLAPKVAADPA